MGRDTTFPIRSMQWADREMNSMITSGSDMLPGGRPYAAVSAIDHESESEEVVAEPLEPPGRPNRVVVALSGPLIAVLTVSAALVDSPLIPLW